MTLRTLDEVVELLKKDLGTKVGAHKYSVVTDKDKLEIALAQGWELRMDSKGEIEIV